MRFTLLLILSLTHLVPAQSQFVCFSDSATIYVFPGTKLPPMTGEATFYSEQFEVKVGGKFLAAQTPGSEAIYNCDMLVLDYEDNKTYVLPLSYFPPFVADQFSGVHYCYTMDKDTAYLLGGYGYDLAKGYETTFPYMTIFHVKSLIDSVVQHKDFLQLFEVVSDNRLAITGGTLVHHGDYFLVNDGQEITPLQDEVTDHLTINEWDFRGQMRKFRLKNTDGYREVDEFQICTTAKTFYQCMPAKWRSKPTKVTMVNRSKK
jgi:hypothetical protein